jgi:hypothetical protein
MEPDLLEGRSRHTGAALFTKAKIIIRTGHAIITTKSVYMLLMVSIEP